MSECQAAGSPEEVEEGDEEVEVAASSSAESEPLSGDSQNNSLSGESVGHTPPAPACGEGREGKAVDRERREESRWRRG